MCTKPGAIHHPTQDGLPAVAAVTRSCFGGSIRSLPDSLQRVIARNRIAAK
ncbi:hypothetical protein [Gordonia rhizosphera]|uniref:hypothetical protein n=1 Tax=Gordonia rhizosphera TaxID=83341 RepID=UPI0002E1A0CD|nr:hypothetical protein [Gordonia rhizosphera]